MDIRKLNTGFRGELGQWKKPNATNIGGLPRRKADATFGLANWKTLTVNEMDVTALDLALRGAACGLLLMMVLVLLQLRPTNRHIILTMAFAAGGAVYAVATAPLVPQSLFRWMPPILSAQPVIFWLWARATFDDDFILKRWHGALLLTVVGIGFSVSVAWTSWPTLERSGATTLSVIALVLALLAAVQTVETWRADLVARRRRLRIAVLLMCLLWTTLDAGSNLISVPIAARGAPGNLAVALFLFVVAMLAGWGFFGVKATASAMEATAPIASGKSRDEAQVSNRDSDDRHSIAPILLRRLDNLMTVERIYRQEGLSIGGLAARLDLPEYRLRQLINEGLGYRNFNAFLNHYRIDEAKAALSDLSQRDVQVLTIAMDAGFQSIGPFNRAFKADTGMTPTEFRRHALVRSQAAASPSKDNFKVGQSY
jgi:AraC-like DNA-binding protein